MVYGNCMSFIIKWLRSEIRQKLKAYFGMLGERLKLKHVPLSI